LSNPGDASGLTWLTLAWDNAAGVSGSAELGKIAAHTITGLANNSGMSTVTVTVKNGTVSSAGATVTANTADQRVNDFNLTGLVVAPERGAVPNTGTISHTQYTGSVVWRQNDGTTAVSGNFAAATVYKAIVTLTARTGYTFNEVTANVFSYDGATVTNPAGTGTGISVIITFPATAAPSGVPGLRYVKKDGTGNGSSWEHASGDLQRMIDEAGADKAANNSIRAIVRVAEGTYTPRYKPDSNGASITPPAGEEQDQTFILRYGVEIRGGYPASATNTTSDEDRGWTAHVTILSGDIDNNDTTRINGNNAHHVVLGVDVPGAVLDGLTIKGGKADGSSSITVKSKAVLKSDGGGIYNDSSSPVLTNVTIMDNIADNNGGGMYNASSSSSILTNVIITGNSASGKGGGIYNLESPPVLTNVTVTGNSAASGGGIYSSKSSPVLTNVTIAGNSAASGGGIFIDDTSFHTSRPKIRNSIIWGNSDGITKTAGVPTLDHCLVQDGWPGEGSNNLSSDPEFMAPAEGDYRLTAHSPAINRGSNTYYEPNQTPDLSAITTDIDGAPRSVGGTIDMGAYEEPGGIKPGNAPITLVIDRGQGAFSEETFTIYKNGGAETGTKTIEVTGTGYSNPRWHVDGIQKGTGTSIVINAADYGTGGHSLSLWVELGGVPWSKELDFTVAK
jgi:predicted outer membrane repeat protein